jgi:hypothetical protein
MEDTERVMKSSVNEGNESHNESAKKRMSVPEGLLEPGERKVV